MDKRSILMTCLNVQDGEQVNVAAVGGDRRMPVFGRPNDIGVDSYEGEETMSEMKGGWESTMVVVFA